MFPTTFYDHLTAVEGGQGPLEEGELRGRAAGRGGQHCGVDGGAGEGADDPAGEVLRGAKPAGEARWSVAMAGGEVAGQWSGGQVRRAGEAAED